MYMYVHVHVRGLVNCIIPRKEGLICPIYVHAIFITDTHANPHWIIFRNPIV